MDGGMWRPSATSSCGGGGSEAMSSNRLGWLRLVIRSRNISMVYLLRNQPCDPCDLRDIFGSLKTPHAAQSSRELDRRLLLDPPLRPALRRGAATRARVPAVRLTRPRHHPPDLAGLATRSPRGSKAGNDGQPGDRSLLVAAAVCARPGPLRRAVRATAGSAEPGEPG